MNNYNLVAENSQSTVVGEYVADGTRVAHYQSKADLERAFIKQTIMEQQEKFNKAWELKKQGRLRATALETNN